jgi:hypothetical protein
MHSFLSGSFRQLYEEFDGVSATTDMVVGDLVCVELKMCKLMRLSKHNWRVGEGLLRWKGGKRWALQMSS